MKYLFDIHISDNEKADHLNNSFGNSWPGIISALALLYLDYANAQLYIVTIFLTGVVVLSSLILDLEQRLSQKQILKIKLHKRYQLGLALRSLIYLGISCIISVHIMYFPLLSWQSLLCCGFFIGSAERMIYQNYFNPNFARILLLLFQLPVIFAGFSLQSHNARVLALVLTLQFIVHAKKIRSFYRVYKTKNDLAERVAKERKELKTLLDLIPVGVAKFDHNLTYLHANKYIVDLSKNSLDFIIGKRLGFSGNSDLDFDRIHSFLQSPEDRLEIYTQFRDVRSGQKRRHQMYLQKISSGEIASVAIDIEDTMKAQETLREEREFSLGILNAVSDPIFVKSRDHKIIYGNTAFSEMVGKPFSEYVQKSVHDLLSKDIADPIREQEEEVFKTFQPQELEEILPDKKGGEITVLAKKTPFKLTSGDQVLVGVFRDITHRRRLEIDLMEKSKFASLGQMAAGVAHEINNPLAIIEGKAELLSRQIISGEIPPTEKILTDLKKITETSSRIAKIIKSMRVLAHNHTQNNFETTSLDHLIPNSLGICFEKFKTSGIDLKIHIDVNAEVTADLTQIGQVLINLAMNSFDAVMELPRTQHWVEIRTRVNPRNADRIDIMVTDGGFGISAEVREKIMNPFFTTKKVGKGTGLGLSLSKTIVISHGGEISIDTAHSNTRFIITLPILK